MKRENKLFICIFIILVFLRVLLITGIPKMYIPVVHDDLYYAKAAHYLIHGEWLGPYDQMTLIKGPFYAFFLVFSFLTGLPLLLNETIFYILACVTLFYAIKPLIKNKWWRLLLFTAILYNPTSLATEWTLRVYREFVNLSLTIYVVAFAIGLFLRIDQKFNLVTLWVFCLGLSTGAFILTREVGIWIYPALILLLIAAIWQVWVRELPRKKLRSLILVSSLLLSCIPLWVVSSINYSKYNYWGYSENLDKDYARIRNVLCSIETDYMPPHRSISKVALNQAYVVSPYLEDLSEYIDRKYNDWLILSNISISLKPDWYKEKYPNDEQDIGNSYFIWLLRDAVAENGNYAEGKFPEEYIKTIADQLESACDEGALNCRRGAQLPFIGSINTQNIPIILHYFVDDIYRLLKFDKDVFGIKTLDVLNWENFQSESMKYFDEFAYNPIRYELYGNSDVNDRVIAGNTDIRLKILPIKERIMVFLYDFYKALTIPFLILSISAWLIFFIKNRFSGLKDCRMFVVFIFMLSVFVIRVMTLAIIDATTDNPGFTYSESTVIFVTILIFLIVYSANELRIKKKL